MTQWTPIGGSHFAFGEKPGGFDLRLLADGNGQVRGNVTFDPAKQGPPGHAHGGALATIIDEAMGAACWNSGLQVLAVHLDFNYKRPVPLALEVAVSGRVDRREGRKVHTIGEIVLPDGTIAVQGAGIFVEAPKYFDQAKHNPFLKLPDNE